VRRKSGPRTNARAWQHADTPAVGAHRTVHSACSLASLSNESTNDNLQPAYRNALWLAHTRVRGDSRLASLLFALFRVFVLSRVPHVQFCFPAFAVDQEPTNYELREDGNSFDIRSATRSMQPVSALEPRPKQHDRRHRTLQSSGQAGSESYLDHRPSSKPMRAGGGILRLLSDLKSYQMKTGLRDGPSVHSTRRRPGVVDRDRN
jgi:hypothetical protein